MNVLQILLLTAGIGFVFLLSGYWLAAGLRGATPAERLAAGGLAGLGSLLLMIAAVNFFVPLRGVAAWFCVLLPCGLSLRARSRRGLAEDCRRVFRQPGARWAALGGGALWAALLWPALSDPKLVYYDGSGNHDSFFWIANASHLRAHPYMQLPVFSATRPFTNSADVLVGWLPLWGRMGAEGLLALASATTGLPPLELYRVATGALLLPWVAGVFLVLRAFVFPPGRPRPWVWAAAAGLQPVFVFFHRNDNLPNLLGALMAAALLVGLGRGFPADRAGGPVWPWAALAVLGMHGLLCAYPEMLPFVLLPAGLLVLRVWRGAGWRPAALMAGVVALGFLVNPAVGVRAVNGFRLAVESARADTRWYNLFSTLRPADYVPALTSLAIPTCKLLGRFWGVLMSLGLLAGLALTVRRARDPFGAAVLLAGAGALLAYTLLTGFAYGWQKTTQFAGVCIGALFPAGLLGTLDAAGSGRPGRARFLVRGAMAVLLLFYAAATQDACSGLWEWAGRKRITRDLLNLRAASAAGLSGARVLVVGESFPQPFFYGMWTSYLLPESDLVFSARDRNPGGYLDVDVLREVPGTTPPPDAILVSRAWAETFDAASPRLAQGADYALLTETVRVLEVRGFQSDFGVPREATANASLRLLPPRDAWLHLTLRPGENVRPDAGQLAVDLRTGDEAAATRIPPAPGGPPWNIAVPLKGGVPNTVNLTFTAPGLDPANPRALQVDALRITASP